MATRMLDTAVFSYLHSTNPARGDVYRKHVSGHVLALSFITVGEQYAGIHKRINKGEWNQSHLDKLDSRLRATLIVPYDLEVCRTFGRLEAQMKTSTGSDRVVGVNDLWIAACAVRHSLPLITNNRQHYEGIPGLTIISEAPPR